MQKSTAKKKPAPRPDGSPIKGRPLGVSRFIAGRIRRGHGNEAILRAVRKKSPKSRAGASDVRVVRSKINRGLI